MNMKKWLSTAVLFSSMALTACGGGSDSKASVENNPAASEATQEKTYRVAMNAEFAPFEYATTNGELAGFDVDLIKAMAKEGNFKVEFKNQPWDGLFASLSTGDADALISAVTMTEERQQSFDFTDPYFEIQQVILLPKGKTLANADELKNLSRVGVVTGNTGDLVASKLLGQTSNKIARFESLPLVLKELENNGVDAVISDSAVIDHYLKNNGDKGFTKIETENFDKEYYSIAVQKGDTETLAVFNEALKKVKDKGTFESIYNQYFISK